MTGSKPDMAISGHINDFLVIWRILLSFWFHNTANYCWICLLAEIYQTATHLLKILTWQLRRHFSPLGPNRELGRIPQTPKQSLIWSAVVISSSLPVKLPIKILFPEICIASKVVPWNFRGSPWGYFFDTVVIHEDISGKQPLGRNLPKSDATVKITCLDGEGRFIPLHWSCKAD